jgi:hypothetical protein
MLDHALAYLARGWCVVPAKAASKYPRIKWQEYQNRLPTEAEVREWWSRWPRAGIALLTGSASGLVVVDVDGRKGASTAGHDLTCLMSKTPDGYHLFYEQPPGAKLARNSTNTPSPGGPADIRGEGGIVLLPPSRHQDGDRYAWVLQGEPNEIPDWLDRVTNEAPKNKPKAKAEKTWLTDAIAGKVEPGTRNDTAARLVGYYKHNGLNDEVIRALMVAWNQSLPEPLDEREVLSVVESIDRTHARQAEADARKAADGDEKAANSADPRDKAAGKKPPAFRLTPYQTYMKKHAKWDTRWIFDGWLPDETIAMLVAAPGSFKTWLEFDMAVSIAGGFPFLGHKPGRTGPVIIVQQEDSPGDIVDRISTMHFVKAGLAKPRLLKDKTVVVEFPNDVPIFFHEESSLRFSDPGVMEEFRKKIEAIKPVACFIDPLYSAASAESFMAESVQSMLPLKQWRTEYKTSFILAHHTNKGGTTVRSRQRMWGSQLLNGFLEMGLQVHRPDEFSEWIVVERHSKSGGAIPALKLAYNIDTGDAWRYDVDVTRLTPPEVQELLDVDQDKGKTSRRTAKPATLSALARKVLDAVETRPGTEEALSARLSVPREDIGGALAELMRNSHITQVGDKYATIVDAASVAV